MKIPAPLRFLVLSLACQLVGFGLVVIISQSTGAVSAGLALALQSVLALSAARFLRLPLVWQLFSLLVGPFIIATSQIAMPAWLPMAIGLVIVLLYLPTFWTRVPYYPTTSRAFSVIHGLLPKDKPISFIDLGSGFAGLIRYLSVRHPQSTFSGCEISPLAYLISRVMLLGQKNSIIRFESFWNHDLSNYDIVYAFLSPEPMPKLWQKVQAELKPGGLFISNSFPGPNQATQEIEISAGPQGQRLYLYRR